VPVETDAKRGGNGFIGLDFTTLGFSVRFFASLSVGRPLGFGPEGRGARAQKKIFRTVWLCAQVEPVAQQKKQHFKRWEKIKRKMGRTYYRWDGFYVISDTVHKFFLRFYLNC
jgi:hypothetical protein